MTNTLRPILISGAGFGIGAACAERFAAEEVRLFLVDRNENRCEAIAERTGGFPIVGDIRDVATLERAVNAATIAGGGLSAVIHAVPIADAMDFNTLRSNEFTAAFDTHVASLFGLGLTAVRAMQIHETGVLLRIDAESTPETMSTRVLRAAQDAAWEEIAGVCADYGISAVTLHATADADPIEIAERAYTTITEVLGFENPQTVEHPA